MADKLITPLIIDPVNTFIHDTAAKIVDSGLATSVADVLKSVIDSGAAAVNSSLTKIKELTEVS